MTEKQKERMLLHVCCAPCSPHVVAKLCEEYDVTLYFYNPNIHPLAEYKTRADELRSWCRAAGLDLIVDEYDVKRWFAATHEYADEPEKGARCEICFDLRLGRTAYVAGRNGYDLFGTVLTVSPRKESIVINRVGRRHEELSGVPFLEADWKKKEGTKLTNLLARDLGFYRQDYCGCVYSHRDRKRQQEEKAARESVG
ncbi:MAG: epoxyqueuosine reductase QueH [Nitrospinae bacterium]|nr:epoxyqueuosine reductase QueH [Nitrospinota bacterium]